MEVHYCDVCGQKLLDEDIAKGNAVYDAQKRIICKKCKKTASTIIPVGPSLTPRKSKSSVRLPAVSSLPPPEPLPAPRPSSIQIPAADFNPQPKSTLNLYFCEQCGKRMSEIDIEAGRAHNKKRRGFFCNTCAVGVNTIEFDAITDEQISTHIKEGSTAPKPPLGSKTRLQAVKRVEAHVPRHVPPRKRSTAMLSILIAAGLGLLVGAAMLIKSHSKSSEKNLAESGKKGDEVAAVPSVEVTHDLDRFKVEAARLDEEKRKAEEPPKVTPQKPVAETPAPTLHEAQPPKPPTAVQPEMQKPEITSVQQPLPSALPLQVPTVNSAQIATEAKLKYEETIAAVYTLLRKNPKAALEELNDAKADPKLGTFRTALDLDIECARYTDELDKAALLGAALLKDGRAFKFDRSNGKDLAVGVGTKNKVKDVKDNDIIIDIDLGGGTAMSRLPLDQLTGISRYELATLGMPPGPDSELKLAFGGLLLLYGGEKGIAMTSVRALLDAARKTQTSPEKIDHLAQRLNALEREGMAEVAIRKVVTLVKEDKGQEAFATFNDLTKDFGSTRALAAGLPAVMEQLEKLSKPGVLATYFDYAGPLAAALNEATPGRLGIKVLPNVYIPNEVELQKIFGRNTLGIIFSGTLHVPKDGDYTFYLNSDDGSVLYIDEKMTVNYDGGHGMYEEKTGTVKLKAGPVPFRLNYYQSGGPGGLLVSWSGPDIPKQTIPPSVFTHKMTGAEPAMAGAPAASAAGNPPVVKAPPLPDAKILFLSAIDPAEVSTVDSNYGKGTMSDGKTAITVNKIPSPHGLGMVPAANGFGHVSYKLNKLFRVFAVSVALNDTSKFPKTPVTFKVLGDGKPLWSSKPIRNLRSIQECTLNIIGVDLLTLEVENPGGDDPAVVWIEPQIAK